MACGGRPPPTSWIVRVASWAGSSARARGNHRKPARSSRHCSTPTDRLNLLGGAAQDSSRVTYFECDGPVLPRLAGRRRAPTIIENPAKIRVSASRFRFGIGGALLAPRGERCNVATRHRPKFGRGTPMEKKASRVVLAVVALA